MRRFTVSDIPITPFLSSKHAGIAYGGWIANFDVPDLFGRYRATVHVPRRPYVEQLNGIPTIRPFEALACGYSPDLFVLA